MVKVTSLFISLIMLIGIAFQNCSIIPVNRLSDNTSAMLSKPENSLTKPSELNYRGKRKRREEKINYQSSSSSIHQPLQSDDYISVDSLAY
ncbi:uncharacterized protein LOC128391900 isoform X3 [Panonychus citri]|uniref:uncharacterized protein LOC128391900 isoform X3 n=1 Tax=Panonychus citri TaxID=50023 RepID=UPI002307EDB8|nr:uncharacterized protein LOC128391900 isoform X3 [Panonychus citri]